MKLLAEGILESGRRVTVSYEEIDRTIAVVVEKDTSTRIGRSRRTIPVHQNGWLFVFGQPLVERIRQAVIECDEEIEASKQPPGDPNKRLVDAAYAALYHGIPRSDKNRSGAPPLVRPPTDPPRVPAPKR